MKKILFLLFFPTLVFGQSFQSLHSPIGTDSLWLKYLQIYESSSLISPISIYQDNTNENLEIDGSVDISGSFEAGSLKVPADGAHTDGDVISVLNDNGSTFIVDTSANTTVSGEIINNDILKIKNSTSGGTGASRTVTFEVVDNNGDDAYDGTRRHVVHIWSSTSEYGSPGKLALVSIGNLTKGTKIYTPFALNWNPEGTVDHVLTDADGVIEFTITSTGASGLTNQWFMVEIQGTVWTFAIEMFNSAS